MASKSTTYEDLLSKRAALDDELRPLQQARHAELRKQRDDIEAQLQPLWDELATRPNGAREDELRAQIKAIKEPMFGIDKELGELNRQMADPKTGIAKTA